MTMCGATGDIRARTFDKSIVPETSDLGANRPITDRLGPSSVTRDVSADGTTTTSGRMRSRWGSARSVLFLLDMRSCHDYVREKTADGQRMAIPLSMTMSERPDVVVRLLPSPALSMTT